MASNFFGQLFRITTFGESHGPAIGVVIDGCPAGLPITLDEIQRELARRQPGKTPYTTPRKEEDKVEILSGFFQGKTTGAPIALLIHNKDKDSSKYTPIENLLRPGHANYTYLEKYGIFDPAGGGRASARETAARVAAGAIAKKLLAELYNIQICAFILAIGGISLDKLPSEDLSSLRQKIEASSIFCPDEVAATKMMQEIEKVKKEGDSLGGVLGCITKNIPLGLGDPIYGKIEALLASAMLSLPASKGFEIGSGFNGAKMRGSEHNDPFDLGLDGTITMSTNHAGGTLGGITTALPLFFRVAFKPTSSIQKPQKTVSITGEKKGFQLPSGSRHDPCVAIRAVPVVEAMTALVLADAALMNRSSRLSGP